MSLQYLKINFSNKKLSNFEQNYFFDIFNNFKRPKFFLDLHTFQIHYE